MCKEEFAVEINAPVWLELGSHIEHLLLGHISVLRLVDCPIHETT